MKLSLADWNRLNMAYTPYTLVVYHPDSVELVLLDKLEAARKDARLEEVSGERGEINET